MPGAASVLWLAGEGTGPTDAFLADLRGALDQRRWSPSLRTVPLAGPPPGRSPWAHRQDRQQPLRWGPGDGDEGAEELAELASDRAPFDGLVLVGACQGHTDQELRTLLRQVVPLLRSEAPWLLVERNGRAASQIVRSLSRPDSARGEGRGTVRAVEELRRLLETGGLGMAGAWSLPPRRRRQRILASLIGQDAAAEWFVARGARIR